MTIHSVSLVLFIPKKGYLICNEFRKFQQKNLYHLIGGKVEETDLNPFDSAIREFIEETSLNIFLKDSKYVLRENLIKNKSFNICTHYQKQLYHRFFICEIQDENLLNFFNEFPSEFEKVENKNLNKLLFIEKEKFDNIKEDSTELLIKFFRKL